MPEFIYPDDYCSVKVVKPIQKANSKISMNQLDVVFIGKGEEPY